MLKSKDFRLILLAVLALIITLILDVLIRQPDLPPEHLVLANLTDSSAVIAWTTSRPARGGVAISTQQNRLLRTLEFVFSPRTFFSDEINGDTHYVFLKDLAVEMPYYYRVYSGGRFWKEGGNGRVLPSLKTAGILAAPGLPQPIFGRILDTDQAPTANALVEIFLVNRSNHNLIASKSLVSYTNEEGFWQSDLGNLRAFDGGSLAAVDDFQHDLFVQVSAPGGRVQAEFLPLSNDKNLGEIILR
ncbi:MAG: hypothetical protein ABH807_02475 [Candidatus Shapirobacteria bacterium]